ncbi:MAG: hypothetical protein JXR95_07055 [Deltaproteobacteria bacterium]|nr:hypothetical protein [Deltaproteobacteria bacterium]
MKLTTDIFREIKFLSIGQVTHDRYGDSICPGGCAYFGAKTASGLGSQVKLLTSIGSDFECDNFLIDLEVHGVREGFTTVFTNTYPDGDLRVQLVETQSPPISFTHLPESWKSTDALFIAPVFEEIDASEPWLSGINSSTKSVSLQGFMKTSQGNDQKKLVVRGGDIREFDFPGVNAFFLSEEDIVLFGYPGFLEWLRATADLVFVTQGEKGSIIYEGPKEYYASIYPVQNALDPTGAGDTYAGAATLALSAGFNPIESALLGASAASVVVEKLGSEGLENISEAFSRYNNTLPG